MLQYNENMLKIVVQMKKRKKTWKGNVYIERDKKNEMKWNETILYNNSIFE